jgi:hypothetical protein
MLKLCDVSIFTFLVLCFKRIKLPAAAVLLIIRYWASVSDRPFIMEKVEDVTSYTVHTKYYHVVYLSQFEFLLQN